MGVVETAKEYAYRKVWGEHSLTIGEIAGMVVGVLVILFGGGFLGSWALWVGLATIVVSMALF